MVDAALSFGSAADAYDRGRPSYPVEAIRWMVGTPGTTFVSVLELGAGTGKLTRGLVDERYHVFATDPDDAMLDVLSEKMPEVRATKAVAEQLPVPDRTVDVVVAAQAYHWFDTERALPEMARVLKPGGHVALAWNRFDESIPWVRKLRAIIGAAPSDGFDPTDSLVMSGYFADVQTESFGFWLDIDKASLVALAKSRSVFIDKTSEEQVEILAKVEALYDDYGRGTGGMRLPYVCEVWRATVTDKQPVTPPLPQTLITSAPEAELEVDDPTAVALPRVPIDEPPSDEVKLFTWH